MDGPISSAEPTSRECIDCTVDYEVAFWASHFGLDQAELLKVIANVGPRLSDVTAEIILRK